MQRRRLFLFLLAAALFLILVIGEVYLLTFTNTGSSKTTTTSGHTSTSVLPTGSQTSTFSSVTIGQTSSVVSVTSTSSKSFSTTPGQVEATYVTSSQPNSSQWLVISSDSLPISILANNTGSIPEYNSLAALNQTRIGVYCTFVDKSGACLSFEQFLETGWFWNSSDKILYVHYVGGPAVKLSVFIKVGGV